MTKITVDCNILILLGTFFSEISDLKSLSYLNSSFNDALETLLSLSSPTKSIPSAELFPLNYDFS
jgi:hypothetical protein